MELTQSFHYQGWTIRYRVLEPSPSSAETTEVSTVVFVHGTPWSSVTFVPLAKALSATGRYRILLYDLPGYGESQSYERQPGESNTKPFEGDTSVKLQASALNELLLFLRIDGKEGREVPAVIAHDIAGTIALRAHLLHGCDFHSLCLMDTNTVLPWGDGFYKLARSEAEVFMKLPYGQYEAMLRSTIRSAFHEPNEPRSKWEDALAKPWLKNESTKHESSTTSNVQRSFFRQIAQANDADVAEMLDENLYEKVRCPVKIIWGESDKWIPREKMDQLAGMLGQRMKEFVTIPEAGHLIMVDQPERVAVEVCSWLANN